MNCCLQLYTYVLFFSHLQLPHTSPNSMLRPTPRYSSIFYSCDLINISYSCVELLSHVDISNSTSTNFQYLSPLMEVSKPVTNRSDAKRNTRQNRRRISIPHYVQKYRNILYRPNFYNYSIITVPCTS